MPANSRDADNSVTGQVNVSSTESVEVATQLGMACASCSAKCGVRQIPQTTVVRARASGLFSSGQSVILEADEGALAQISLSLYLVPAIGFLLGAFLAFSLSLGDGQQALFALVGLTSGLLLARRILRRRYSAGVPLCAVQTTDK